MDSTAQVVDVLEEGEVMGDRSNIKVRYRDGRSVYFYGHWMGEDNIKIVQEALDENRRVEDEAYFARILFSKMIEHDVQGETGFGISPYVVDNQYPVVVVDYHKSSNGRPVIYEEEEE